MKVKAPSRGISAATRLAAALSCAILILALSILAYSPLHKDSPQQQRGVCPFCQFQHLAAEPAPSQAVALIPLRTVATLHLAEPEWHPRLLHSPHSGRAPPISIPAA